LYIAPPMLPKKPATGFDPFACVPSSSGPDAATAWSRDAAIAASLSRCVNRLVLLFSLRSANRRDSTSCRSLATSSSSASCPSFARGASREEAYTFGFRAPSSSGPGTLGSPNARSPQQRLPPAGAMAGLRLPGGPSVQAQAAARAKPAGEGGAAQNAGRCCPPAARPAHHAAATARRARVRISDATLSRASAAKPGAGS